jgi:hypothetical protein
MTFNINKAPKQPPLLLAVAVEVNGQMSCFALLSTPRSVHLTCMHQEVLVDWVEYLQYRIGTDSCNILATPTEMTGLGCCSCICTVLLLLTAQLSTA